MARLRALGPIGVDDALERRLVLLMCGTQRSRAARASEALDLLLSVDSARLLALLRKLNLVAMVGQRLQVLGPDLDPLLRSEISSWTEKMRVRGRLHELLTLSILDRLEASGIRALPLKGAVLARELYGDVARRSSGDVDILVSAGDLAGAIEAIQAMGWRWKEPVARASKLPVLHETLWHEALPRVELHWRVHWYEDRFAPDALQHADASGPQGSLRMRPIDGLATLILFYARDGFSGLRMAADVAAWWDMRCSGEDVDRLVDATVCAYPALAGPLRVGAQLLGSLVGLPTRARHDSFRWKVAAELAMPFYEVPTAQLGANASLVDLLLAPPHGATESLRRERQKIPENLERPLTRDDELSLHLARWEHLLRMGRRWGVAIGPAVLHAFGLGATDRRTAIGAR